MAHDNAQSVLKELCVETIQEIKVKKIEPLFVNENEVEYNRLGRAEVERVIKQISENTKFLTVKISFYENL